MRSSPTSTRAGKTGFLVPASKASGLGHYFRTLPYQRRMSGSLFLSEGELIRTLSPGAVLLPPLTQTEAVLSELSKQGIDSLLVDHYGLPEPLLAELASQTGIRVVYFDATYANRPFSGLLNSNPFAGESAYPRRHPATRYFLGSGFYLFREELEQAKGTPKENRCFICFGGTDALDFTEVALRALPKAGAYTVVLGPGVGAETKARVERALAERGLDASLHVSPPDFFLLMARCERALLSCSTIVYEAARLGLEVSCLQVAGNQTILADFLRQNGVEVRDARGVAPDLSGLEFHRVALEFGGRAEELIEFLRS